MQKISHSREEVTSAFAKAKSVADAAKILGLSGNNYRKVHFLAQHYGLPKPVYKSSEINSAKAIRIPLEAILVKGSYYSTGSLKKRLVKSGLLDYICAICKLDPDSSSQWKDITLQLDHINGDSSDNRIENLRILCPNCHTQTETYGIGTGKKYANGKTGKCVSCKRKSPNSSICWRCDSSYIDFPAIETILVMLETLSRKEVADKLQISEQKLSAKMMNYAIQLVKQFGDNKMISQHYSKKPAVIVKRAPKIKSDYPPVEELIEEIKHSSFTAVAKRLGVSDNAVRKYIKRISGEEAVPKGYPKNFQSHKLSSGQEKLYASDVHTIIDQLENSNENIVSIAKTFGVASTTLRAWIESELGHRYIAPRNKTTTNPNMGKVLYPDLETLLKSIAKDGNENTAKALGATSRAVERHLRKHLPDSAFPLKRSGFLDRYAES